MITDSMTKHIIGSKLSLFFKRTQILFTTLFFIPLSHENFFVILSFLVSILVDLLDLSGSRAIFNHIWLVKSISTMVTLPCSTILMQSIKESLLETFCVFSCRDEAFNAV